MKVLIITGEPFPNGMAATNRIKCFARAIHEGGLECEVVDYRRTEVYGIPPKNVDGEGTFCGISYHYVSGSPLRGSNRVIRYVNDRLDIKKAERYIRKYLDNGDVLFLYMGGDVQLMLRFMNAAKSKGAYCIRDLCELPYGTSAETARTIRLRKKTFECQFPKLDGIISISDSLQNLARTYSLPSCKHIKVPILVDYKKFSIVKHLNSAMKPYIFHAGTLDQQKDGILGMFEAFGLACQRIKTPIKYVLTGSINQSRYSIELEEIIKKYEIADRIEFVGYLNSDQIKEYLRGASLVISNRSKSKQNFYGFSTKVGEYLASGTPLLTTNWGEAVNWLVNGESAYITEPENTEALAEAIVHVFTNPEEALKIGLAGQEVCRNSFDYRNWSKPLVEFMDQLGK